MTLTNATEICFSCRRFETKCEFIFREKNYWYLLSEFRAIQFWFLFITHLSLITYIVESDRYFRQASHIRSLWSVNRFQDLPISDRDGLRIFHIDIESRWLPSGPQPFPLQRIVNPDEINPHDHQGSRRFRPRCEEIEQVFMILFFCGDDDPCVRSISHSAIYDIISIVSHSESTM